MMNDFHTVEIWKCHFPTLHHDDYVVGVDDGEDDGLAHPSPIVWLLHADDGVRCMGCREAEQPCKKNIKQTMNQFSDKGLFDFALLFLPNWLPPPIFLETKCP